MRDVVLSQPDSSYYITVQSLVETRYTQEKQATRQEVISALGDFFRSTSHMLNEVRHRNKAKIDRLEDYLRKNDQN